MYYITLNSSSLHHMFKMETNGLLLVGIVALLIFLFATILAYVIYSGLLTNIEVKTCKPPFQALSVAYKFARGPYKNSSELFTQVHSLVPHLDCFGIYYDDPHSVSPAGLRYTVGVVLGDGTFSADDATKQLLEDGGYKTAVFPAVDHVVMASFPFNGTLSIMIAVARVYPHLGEYIRERKLCAHPFLEIYGKNEILFVAPLSKQDEFYVPEALVEVESEIEEDEEADEEIDVGTEPSIVQESTSNRENKVKLILKQDGNSKQETLSQKSSSSSFEELHLET